MKVRILTIVAAGFGITCFAQSKVNLTYQEAVQIALKNNVILNQERNIQYAAAAGKTAALANFAPSVSAGLNAYHASGNQFIQSEARLVQYETNNLSPNVNASVMVFNGFNRLNTYKEADKQIDAQENMVKRTSQDVISSVANQFLQCLLDQEIVRIDGQDAEYERKLSEQIKAQVSLGSRAPVDEYNQVAAVKAAELAFTRAKSTLRDDKASLAQTLQMDPGEEFDLTEPRWSVDTTQMDTSMLAQLFETALSNRGDYQRASNMERVNHLQWSVSKTAALPSLAAFGYFGSFVTDGSPSGFETQFNTNHNFQYGLSLNIPIFSGLQNHSRSVQAQMIYENSKLATSNVENKVKSDVIQAFQRRRDAITNYRAADSQLGAAKVAFDYESERYRLGITNFVDLSQANKTYVKAQTDFAQAIYNLKFQEVLLDYALGTLTEEDIQ